MRKCVMPAALLLTGMLTISAAVAFGAAEQKDPWAEALLAARAKFAQTEQATEPAPPAPAKAPPVKFGPWQVTAPQPSKEFATTHLPAANIDLQAKDKKGQALWATQKKWRDGQVIKLTPNIVGSTYLFRTITAKNACKYPAGFGSDDGLEVWLNGEKIVSNGTPRGTVPDSDLATLELNAGKNELLLKIFNLRGGHSFYFGAAGGAGQAANQSASYMKVLKPVTNAFPRESAWFTSDLGRNGVSGWFEAAGATKIERGLIEDVLRKLDVFGAEAQSDYRALAQAQAGADDPRWLALYARAKGLEEATVAVRKVNLRALRMAVEDLTATFGERYPKGPEYLRRLREMEKVFTQGAKALAAGDQATEQNLLALSADVAALEREALLANPLLDFDRLLVVRRVLGGKARGAMSGALGLPSLNSRTHDTIPHKGWDNDVAVLSDLRGQGALRTLYKPADDIILTDVDLHFDADRLMFSSIGTHDRWHILEVDADGSNLRQLTPADVNDIDFFDSCYLPNGKLAVTSTAGYQGLPCEGGKRPMAQLYVLDPRDRGPARIRQIAFDQDSDWCPTVLNNGRLMYLRWEYTDTPHYFGRILFHANPDGTEQMEYYGSNSYFPNAYFFARPIPHHPTQVVGVVGGHHGVSRSGRLLILDPALGRHEADGAVQEIPGWGRKVEPIIKDRLVDGVWPQFLHPYPLGDPGDPRGAGKYFLAAMKPDANALWGIYLVDVFDNLTLLKEVEDAALLEPVPFRKTPPPPVVPDRTEPGRKDAIVFLTDVYSGPGLKGVARGAVKRLRVIAYHYAHNSSGGHASVGVESSWDIKRILGTVPVEADGSALFRIPANTPVAVQPLDERGRALQLMKSWMTGMPGEIVSCVGCHDKQNAAVPNRQTLASRRTPSEIEPWLGPARPFSFKYEVQPVLDKYCVGCHDGEPRGGKALPNFTKTSDERIAYSGDRAYMALHPFVRRPGPESDIHLFAPMDYHASTSELIQMLEKGHHGVNLDREAWERLYCWIDFNAPYRGKWAPNEWRGYDQRQRRIELAKRYANVDADPEGEYDAIAALFAQRAPIKPIVPAPVAKIEPVVMRAADWPFDAAEAKRRQLKAGLPVTRTVDIGDGVKLELALVPAGEFVMGDPSGANDERPLSRVRIAQPFWMGVREITNEQYAQFDPTHDSRYIDQRWKDHEIPGYPANGPKQPVIRVSWNRALAYCEWLSAKTGQTFTLPAESEWEWACRAGADTPFWFGPADADFGKFANLADLTSKLLAVKGCSPKIIPNPKPSEAFLPKVETVDDGQKISAAVGGYRPNPWGLQDMHGNVAEWTRSAYRPYPYDADDGRDDPAAAGRKVVRGGSWRDRPHRATAAYRLAYEAYQPATGVGFRVVLLPGKGAPGRVAATQP